MLSKAVLSTSARVAAAVAVVAAPLEALSHSQCERVTSANETRRSSRFESREPSVKCEPPLRDRDAGLPQEPDDTPSTDQCKTSQGEPHGGSLRSLLQRWNAFGDSH